jgi:hypothetical protein
VICQRELLSLFRSAFPSVTFVAVGDTLPAFDYHAPLMSLPHYLGTILTETPYLKALPADVAAWRARIPAGSLNVGLVWAGNRVHKNDHNRSIALAEFAPLAEAPGVQLFSLQKGARGLGNMPAAFAITDLAEELTDFSQTAAALTCLDLLISVDTSVVHLAGALARPVWTLLPMAADWRWQRSGDTTPWYPTMKLFRQTERKNWGAVIKRVGDDLRSESR